MIRTEELALVQGWDDTKRALRAWRARPCRVLGAVGARRARRRGRCCWPPPGWSPRSRRPTRRRASFPGVTRPADPRRLGFVLDRNALVLALHALACVAGFIAGSSLPTVADGYTGSSRWVHEHAGPLAIAFVLAATLFSLGTQAYVLGGQASTLAAEFGMSPALLLVCLLPHALPELTALFLPLAAWTIASRRGAWDELLAATFVTVAIAVPCSSPRRRSRPGSRRT